LSVIGAIGVGGGVYTTAQDALIARASDKILAVRIDQTIATGVRRLITELHGGTGIARGLAAELRVAVFGAIAMEAVVRTMCAVHEMKAQAACAGIIRARHTVIAMPSAKTLHTGIIRLAA
jgi:hypothetical protein